MREESLTRRRSIFDDTETHRVEYNCVDEVLETGYWDWLEVLWEPTEPFIYVDEGPDEW
jgi:hypothetical protein